MTTQDILAEEAEKTTQELLQLLTASEQEQWNVAPAEGAWTAGQVAEHLVKASIVSILYGPVKPTQRPPDQYVQSLKGQFLNFTIQMTSPAFILPSATTRGREQELLRTLEHNGAQILEAIQTLDLSATCVYTPSELGELTRLELIYFHLYHTQRHLYQLKKIFQKIAHSPHLQNDDVPKAAPETYP